MKKVRKQDAARVEKMRERRNEEDMLAAIRSQPETRSQSRSSIAVAERLQESGRNSVVKLERMKRNTTRSPPAFHPKLDPESLAIVHRLRSTDNEKVEDRLLRLGRRIKAVKDAKVQQIMENPQEPASLETIERLMQYQQIYRDHRMILSKGRDERPTFTPTLDRVSEEIMACKGKLDVNRPKLTEKVGRNSEMEWTFSPKLDPESRRIAALKGSSADRLTSPQAKVESEPSKECTFRPAINQRGRASPGSPPRWEALYDLNLQRMEHKANLQVEADRAKWSFRPNISPASPQPGGKPVVSRLLSWGKEKIEKLKKKQREKMDPDLEECTFAPSVKANIEVFELGVDDAARPRSAVLALYGEPNAVCEVVFAVSPVHKVANPEAEYRGAPQIRHAGNDTDGD